MQSDKCKAENAERQDNQAVAARIPLDLSERLLHFAVRVGKVVNALPATRLGRHIAAQLIRSGTSAAPNYEEGCAAESRADFVHKLSICLKELRESRFWIRLIIESELLPTKKMKDLEDECTRNCARLSPSPCSPQKRTKAKEDDKTPSILHFRFCILDFTLP